MGISSVLALASSSHRRICNLFGTYFSALEVTAKKRAAKNELKPNSFGPVLLKLNKMLIKPPITPTIKRVREYIPVCVSAGGAAAEERWCFGVQHLHSDSSRERGAGSLGP